MITAVDALKLPGAKPGELENDSVAKAMKLIDEHVRKEMRYDGVPFDFSGEMPPSVAMLITQALEAKGWVCVWQNYSRQGKFTSRMETGVMLKLIPSKDAYVEAGYLPAVSSLVGAR